MVKSKICHFIMAIYFLVIVFSFIPVSGGFYDDAVIIEGESLSLLFCTLNLH